VRSLAKALFTKTACRYQVQAHRLPPDALGRDQAIGDVVSLVMGGRMKGLIDPGYLRSTGEGSLQPLDTFVLPPRGDALVDVEEDRERPVARPSLTDHGIYSLA
jgi:hypothetical protein